MSKLGSIFNQRNVVRVSERRLAAVKTLNTRRTLNVSAAASIKTYPYGPEDIAIEPEKLPSVGVSASDALSWNGDLLVIGCFEEAFETVDDATVIKSEELKKMDQALGGALSDIIASTDFKPKPGSCQKIRAGKGAKFVALCGLGPAAKATPTSDWGASAWHSLGASVAGALKGTKTKSVAITVADAGLVSDDVKVAAAGKIANGLLNSGYEATRFKSKTTPPSLETVDLLLGGAASNAADGVTRAVNMAKGALFTRYLVEAPPNVCTPTYLAEAAAHIASIAPEVMSLQVLEKEDCEKLGMGCYLGVSEASAEPPKFIHLTYTPKGPVKKKIAIVGKGLTFDSGGYNIKAGAGSMIELMKFDMGGAGATLGAARALAAIQPEGVEVHFIIASCENMVDARGMRPGDILVASNGKTIEINNTDAEGRLTLCDALLYAQDKGAEAVVDVATLTGACIVALGTGIAGMYANNDGMAADLQEAGKLAGEKLWRMPLEDSYLDSLKSPIADLKNSGGRFGGSITAALFLKEFVDNDKVSWAHLDIAGPVWDEKSNIATGYGAQLLAEWAIGQGK